MMIDIDYFKKINDTLGHKMGDHVLKEVAKVLSDSFRKTDVVSRYGGDEFLIFLPGFCNESSLGIKCQEICDKMTYISAGSCTVTCSIGVSILSEEDVSFDDFLISADKALYKTKTCNKGHFTIIHYGDNI